MSNDLRNLQIVAAIASGATLLSLGMVYLTSTYYARKLQELEDKRAADMRMLLGQSSMDEDLEPSPRHPGRPPRGPSFKPAGVGGGLPSHRSGPPQNRTVKSLDRHRPTPRHGPMVGIESREGSGQPGTSRLHGPAFDSRTEPSYDDPRDSGPRRSLPRPFPLNSNSGGGGGGLRGQSDRATPRASGMDPLDPNSIDEMPDVSSWQRAQRYEFINKQSGAVGMSQEGSGGLLKSPGRSRIMPGGDEEVLYPDSDAGGRESYNDGATAPGTVRPSEGGPLDDPTPPSAPILPQVASRAVPIRPQPQAPQIVNGHQGGVMAASPVNQQGLWPHPPPSRSPVIGLPASFAAAQATVPPHLQLAALSSSPRPVPPPLAHAAPTKLDSKPALSPVASLENYVQVMTADIHLSDEQEEVCAMLLECLALRDKWLFKDGAQVLGVAHRPECACLKDVMPAPFSWEDSPPSDHRFAMVDGVVQVMGADGRRLFEPPGTARDFFTDMQRVLKVCSLGPVKTFCHHRLMLLEQKFNLHLMLNGDKEFTAQKTAPHRDFYNVRKVDTHVHHSSGMHQKHLLRFIKAKLKREPDEVVIFRDGKYLTLREVFESLHLSAYDLSVDTLDMHADKNTFHRFDKFNLKYNPCGQSRLREIFIKQDNLIHGRFLAELTKEMFIDLEASKYQHAEYRISIYGRQQREWDTLASWVVTHNLYSSNVTWLIQLPRLYNIYKQQGTIEHFGQILDNIFLPLFEVTQDPASHPHLHMFLKTVVGFDMVDDESKPERRPTRNARAPQDWDSANNPPYSYWCYYVYSNLYVLNRFREARGMNTFQFRPHAGEAGDIDHLASTLLSAENIAHGINLRKSPVLQYLYYLGRIGLCMSPLSNNSLFLDYHKNPFPVFFARGLFVSLSSDDPLQIHLTKEPLVEEYSVAAQVWKLSSCDLCEVARNSVLQSGFPPECKKHWISENFWVPGPAGNDIHKTNVPDLRMRFRHETYLEESHLCLRGGAAYQTRMMAKMGHQPSPVLAASVPIQQLQGQGGKAN